MAISAGQHYERGTRTKVTKHGSIVLTEYWLSCEWDNETAEYIYTLTKAKWIYFGKERYEDGDYSSESRWTWSGNKEWAERMAYHYEIPMPAEIDYNTAPGVSLKKLGLEQ